MQSGADDLVRALKAGGVDTLFGIPSIHNIRLYETLREEPSIRHILCRQEATATNMADGYARAGNRLGVVAASTGPGTGYVVPAVHEAWGSSSPLLVITTNIAAPKIGKGLGSLHEMDDQHALFRKITKARFKVRQGDDIHIQVPITVWEASLGTKIEVPTVDGRALLKIPQGTQNGQKFRLREKGVMNTRKGKRGDQIVEVQVQAPPAWDERTREILRELAALHPEDPRSNIWNKVKS